MSAMKVGVKHADYVNEAKDTSKKLTCTGYHSVYEDASGTTSTTI